MKIVMLLLTSLMCIMATDSPTLYVKTFGNPKDRTVIYLHGGPGYNCVNFEATTAQQLADRGFFVIVYDRRGEGRSTDPGAHFTFDETFNDLNSIYSQYGISKATLIGHSFGGIVATKYAEKYPEKINTILLVGAPVKLQETFKTIIATTKEIYKTKNDSINLRYVMMLESMDTSSIEYSSYCFVHAMQNGFYTPKHPTDAARQLYSTFRTDTLLVKYAGQMTYPAPRGFWANEHYTTIDLAPVIAHLESIQIPVYGLYGKDDGLYSPTQVSDLEKLIGPDHLMYLDNCSHNVFIDQQDDFIEACLAWTVD
ncbi:MAG: alpha/beta hydrolase [Saprospiraceae bacterium]|nr:alpha/beta hydrolase [Candidatus Opimibacter iunctus]